MTAESYTPRMGRARIIVANGLAPYGDTLVYTLHALRPTVEATVVEPGLLDPGTARVEPDLVICDCVTERVEAGIRS